MIKSMTGFGKAECDLADKKIIVEIKTLNSKLADISLRIPEIYKEKEIEIRYLLASKIQRGKIDFNIFIENCNYVNYTLNKTLAKKYYNELKLLSFELEEHNFSDFLPILIKMPEVLIPEKKQFDEEEWKHVILTIERAIKQLDVFRIYEGKLLEDDFKQRILLIVQLLEKIEPYEIQRIDKLKEQIKKDLDKWFKNEKVDKNRFEQELIYYIGKMDFTEEKVRLKKHCDFFIVTMDEPLSNGKKLGFISQEIGREINTLGSKANDANIQKIIVQMKDELEKIKEQLFNIL
ncbi:MAG: YicC family protein [Bacteroidales bacterium]|nr:YicC family protein [Bacteroidales bacterium]